MIKEIRDNGALDVASGKRGEVGVFMRGQGVGGPVDPLPVA